MAMTINFRISNPNAMKLTHQLKMNANAINRSRIPLSLIPRVSSLHRLRRLSSSPIQFRQFHFYSNSHSIHYRNPYHNHNQYSNSLDRTQNVHSHTRLHSSPPQSSRCRFSTLASRANTRSRAVTAIQFFFLSAALLLLSLWVYRKVRRGFPSELMLLMSKMSICLSDAENSEDLKSRQRFLSWAEEYRIAAFRLVGLPDPGDRSLEARISELVGQMGWLDESVPPYLYARSAQIIAASALLDDETAERYQIKMSKLNQAKEYYYAALELYGGSAYRTLVAGGDSKVSSASNEKLIRPEIVTIGKQLAWIYYLTDQPKDSLEIFNRTLDIIKELRARDAEVDKTLSVPLESNSHISSKVGAEEIFSENSESEKVIAPFSRSPNQRKLYDEGVEGEIYEQMAVILRSLNNFSNSALFSHKSLYLIDRSLDLSRYSSLDAISLTDFDLVLRALHLTQGLAFDLYNSPSSVEENFSSAHSMAVQAMKLMELIARSAPGVTNFIEPENQFIANHKDSRSINYTGLTGHDGISEPRIIAEPIQYRQENSNNSNSLNFEPSEGEHMKYIRGALELIQQRQAGVAIQSQASSLIPPELSNLTSLWFPARISRVGLLMDGSCVFMNLGSILFSQRKYAESEAAFLVALEFANQAGNQTVVKFILQSLNSLGANQISINTKKK